MNSNFSKYALPILATAVAATVGIWLQPRPTATSTPQTIADFKHVGAPSASADKCDPPADDPAAARPRKLEDLLHDCGERAQ